MTDQAKVLIQKSGGLAMRKILLLGLIVASFANAQDTDRLSRSPEGIANLRADGKSGEAVEFTATVTYRDPIDNFFFLQSAGHAIFVMGRSATAVNVGDFVHVEGVLQQGDLDAFVAQANVTVVEKGGMPKAVPVDLSELRYGDFDGMLVTIECEVRQVLDALGDTRLTCRVEGVDSPVTAKVRRRWRSPESFAEFAGSRVKVTGCLGIYFTPETENGQIGQREIQGYQLYCDGPGAIESAEAAVDKELPVMVDLKSLSSEDFGDGAFATHGQLSLVEYRDGGAELIVFDDSGAVRVQVESGYDLHPGMVLQMAGVKARQQDGSYVYKVNWLRQLYLGKLTAAPRISIRESIEKITPYVRISVEGMPRRVVPGETKYRKYIQLVDGNDSIDVRLQHLALDAIAFASPSVARRIRVTGVVAENLSREGSSARYELVVGSADDVELLEKQTQFWKLAGGVLAGILVACAIAGIWSSVLRSQVEKKTEAVTGVATQLRYSYDAIDAGVLVIDSDRVVLAVNREFCKLAQLDVKFGKSLGDLPQRLNERLNEPEKFEKQWESWLADSESSGSIEVVLDSKSYFVVQSAPVRIVEDGPAIGRIMMWRDETESRQLQAELLHSNKLEAVGRLVSGVAHDFNNILMAISGNLASARLEKDAAVAAIDHQLEVAEEAVFRGADVIRRLLTYSGKPEFCLEPCCINDIIRRLHELVLHTFEASISFEFDLDPAGPFVNVESTAIEQVLLNLYINARDAMSDGGKIRTSTRVIDRGPDRLGTVVISVRDDGVGIPEELEGRIFEPYVTTKSSEHGTGIGLSVSFRAIEQHHGKLRFVRTEGRGSEFQILLPEVKRVDSIDEPPVLSELRGCGTILVVDDEDAVRTCADLILRQRGFSTVVAVDGADAIRKLEENGGSVDVALLDLTMPNMSGRQAMSVIMERWPKVRVVLCSGYLVGSTSPTDELDGPHATVSKPYSADELVSTINRVTNGGIVG